MQTHSNYGAFTPLRKSEDLLHRAKEFDQKRADLPGEHLIVFGLGALLLIAGMRSRTVVRRGLMTAAGTALIGRAASGTGGVSRIARMVKRLG